MVSSKELGFRIKQDFRYNQQELIGLLAVTLVTAFIFTFRDWGADQFDAIAGLKNFFTVLLLVAVSFFFRTACQKIYGLSEAHRADFKVWWVGLIVSLIVAFITLGRVPLILAGAMTTAFMVRQRLGEFRYGFSYWNAGMVAMWGVLGSLILALLFAIGAYFVPESYIFAKGMNLNLLIAFYTLLPFPQLDGINIYFGQRGLYYLAIFLVLLAAVLLLTGTKLGLVLAIIIAAVSAVIYLLIGSEK